MHESLSRPDTQAGRYVSLIAEGRDYQQAYRYARSRIPLRPSVAESAATPAKLTAGAENSTRQSPFRALKRFLTERLRPGIAQPD